MLGVSVGWIFFVNLNIQKPEPLVNRAHYILPALTNDTIGLDHQY